MTFQERSGAREILGADRGARGRRWGWWYVTEHRLKNMQAYTWTILMESVGSPMFYLFAMGVGLGALVDANTGARGIGGVNYLTFVGPALLASAAITSAYQETSFPVMGGFKWGREFFAMNATVVSASQIVNGVLLAFFLRVLFTVTVFWAFLAWFGAAPSPFSFLAVPGTILAGLAFGTPAMAFAASLEDDDGWFSLVSRFVIAPMFLFSGTFYPLASLPLPLQAIGWVSPLWHATELGRMGTYGLAVPLWLAAVHILYLTCLTILGMALSYKIFARRLAR